MGCDAAVTQLLNAIKQFQSTHPVWDATNHVGGRRRASPISIHASRMGCDHTVILCGLFHVFQSTHPVWDATARIIWAYSNGQFQSTHPVWDATFERRLQVLNAIFQSTHPVWDATIPMDNQVM